jgi:hypothetical protein
MSPCDIDDVRVNDYWSLLVMVDDEPRPYLRQMNNARDDAIGLGWLPYTLGLIRILKVEGDNTTAF